MNWFAYWWWWVVNTTTGTEMAEGGFRTMPHCCDQGRCWMHTPNAGSWCRCSCHWCRIARRLKRGRATASRPEWRIGEPGQYAGE